MSDVLVACEESQAVTISLRKRGVKAWSCDLEDCSGGHPEWHMKCDVRDLLPLNWGAVIAFPPCTDLAVSGARWFPIKRADGRQQASIAFFKLFTQLDHVPYVCIENPVGIMSKEYRKPTQYVQPYFFGDPERKKTCLWLKGLPELTPTNIVEPVLVRGDARWHYETGRLPHNERIKARSKTFPGLALAMATQWSKLL